MEVDLATELWEMERHKKKLMAQLDDINEEYKVKSEMLIDLLLEEGKSSTGHINGVGVFSLKRESYPSVTKENMPKFIAHLKECGDAGIVKETIETPTLKAYLSGKMQEFAEQLESDETQKESICGLLNLDIETSCIEIASKYYARYGVSTFQNVKLSHTQKGK